MCDPLESQSHIDDYFALVPDAHVNEYRNGKGSFKVQLLESPEKGNVNPTLRWRSGGGSARRSGEIPLTTIEVGELVIVSVTCLNMGEILEANLLAETTKCNQDHVSNVVT
jgi:hypothetical protein